MEKFSQFSSHCLNKKPITKESHLDFFENIVQATINNILSNEKEQYGVAAYPIATVYLRTLIE